MYNTLKFLIVIFITLLIISCSQSAVTSYPEKKILIASIDSNKIYLNEIDSMISLQQYQLRFNALQMTISKKVLETEAKKQNIPLKELINAQIVNKCEEVTIEDFERYVARLNDSFIDTNNVFKYLTGLKQKDRQAFYVDSLMQYYSIKLKLQPPYYKEIETNQLYSHDIVKSNSNTTVYIISDFHCPACQNVEKQLKCLYDKYEDEVTFKFIYFSDYIDNSALACEAAAKQKKFRKMHDIIFENAELLNQDSIYYEFAKEIGLEIDEFDYEMHNIDLLPPLVKNKENLILKNIYTTPTFIVNNKILDEKYAIDYLEDVIVEEIKLNH